MAAWLAHLYEVEAQAYRRVIEKRRARGVTSNVRLATQAKYLEKACYATLWRFRELAGQTIAGETARKGIWKLAERDWRRI